MTALGNHASVIEAVGSLQASISAGSAANAAAGTGHRRRRAEVLAQGAGVPLGYMPSGPRKPGEGCEDEEQGVLSAELAPGGGARLRLSLLVAGFVVGPAGASVRCITHRTGCDIRSHTDSWRAPGATRARKVRVFVFEGKPRAVVAALHVVAVAVERYRELCGGRYMAMAVDREQTVLNCTFYYSPPPRAAVPYAASLRNHGPPDSPPPGARAGSPPIPAGRLPGPAEETELGGDCIVLVPVRASSGLAAAAAAAGAPLTATEASAELLAALRAASPAGAGSCAPHLTAPLARSASLASALSLEEAGTPPAARGLQRSISLGASALPTPSPAGEGPWAPPLGAPPPARRGLDLRRHPAGCLDDLLAAEAAATAAASAPVAAPAGSSPFSLFSGGGGGLFGAGLLTPAGAVVSTRLGSPAATLGPDAGAVRRLQPQQLFAAPLPGGQASALAAAAAAACGLPAWGEFAQHSPAFHTPALAGLFQEAPAGPAAFPPPGAGGAWEPRS